jgi:subtilisin family serine protease/uncharacterized membrane protein
MKKTAIIGIYCLISWGASAFGLTVSEPALDVDLVAGQASDTVVVLTNTTGAVVDWEAAAIQDSAAQGTDFAALMAGGDAFGYRWADSTEPGGPVFEWVDLGTSGSQLFLGDDDSQEVALPFDFVYYGIRYSSVRVSSNGYLTFGPDGNDHTADPLPSTQLPNAVIAPFWTDLDPTAGGGIFVFNDLSNERFVVEYRDIQRLGGDAGRSFQVILHANGNITFNYPSSTGIGALAANISVGIENADGTVGSQVAYEQVFAPSGLALRFYSPTWLSVAPRTGTLAAGESVELVVGLNAGALVAGDYSGTIEISGGEGLSASLPVSLRVSGEPRIAVNQEALAFDAVGVGGVAERLLTILNPGTDMLNVSALDFSDSAFSAAPDAPFSIAPGDSLRLTLRFAPQAIGEFVASLTVRSDDPATPDLAVGLFGEGIAPSDIAVSSSAVSLTLLAGDSGTVPFNISNNGVAPLNWRAVMDAQIPEVPVAAASNVVSPQQVVEPDFSRPFVADRMIVKFADAPVGSGAMAPASVDASRDGLAEQLGAQSRHTLGGDPAMEVWEIAGAGFMAPASVGPAAGATDEEVARARTEAAIRWMREQPGVVYAEPDYIVSIDSFGPDQPMLPASEDAAVRLPNDPFFGNLWGLNNLGQEGGLADADIDAPEAWLLQSNAAEIVVAVIDTGVDYTHPDLAANIWVNEGEIPGNGLDDDGNGYVDDIHGWDFFNNDRDPMDDHDHGTHCAGTIAAVGDNAIGVTGVAWRARVMALKFLSGSGSGKLSDAIAAIAYAADNGAQVSNNSWGGGGFSQALRDTIADAAEKGMLFVAAAGNDARNNDIEAVYPAGYDAPNVLSVAATSRNDVLASFSNYGAQSVDLAAPGQSILSTVRNNTYALFSGTSMASPHVAGAAAMVLAKNPLLSPEQVKDVLMRSVDPVAALDGRVLTGGRLNLHSALNAVSPPWFNLQPSEGIVAPGELLAASVAFSADSLPTGSYDGNILLFSDDPDQPLLTVPVALTIQSAPGIAVSADVVEFGDVFRGGTTTRMLTVRNAGTELLEVQSATISGPFSISGSFPVSLEPGERLELPVTARGLSLGPIAGQLTIQSSDPTDPQLAVALSGTTVAAPVINAVTPRLDTVLRSGDTAMLPITVSNSGGNPLEIEVVGGLPDWLTVGPERGSLPPGESIDMEFAIDASGMVAGQYAASIELRSNDPARPSQTVLTVLEVRDGAHLVIDPGAIDFDIVYLGHPQTRQLTLHNAGNATLNVASTSVSGTGFVLATGYSGGIAPGSSATLAVRAEPTAAGAQSGTLTISSDAPDAPVVEISLSMDARIAPALVVDPASFTLALNEGDSASRTLHLSNAGVDALDVVMAIEAEGEGSAFGEILTEFNLTEITGDDGILSAQYLNGRFYVSGRNAGPNVPQIYVLDREGNYISQFSLPGVTAGSWGARDMTHDGYFLYAAWEGGVVKFDISGNAHGSLPIPGEIIRPNSIAYDPTNDHFYVGNFSSDLLEIDRSGNIIRRFAQPEEMSNMFGLAWDDATPGGPFLWVAEIYELPTRRIYQFDPVAGAFTGLTFRVNPGVGWGGGLGFTTEWLPGQAVLAAVAQSSDDWLYMVNIADVQNWLSLDNFATTIAEDSSKAIALSIHADGLLGGEHTARIRITSNDPVNPLIEVPVTLTVSGTPEIELPGPDVSFGSATFVGNVATREYRIRNSGTDTLQITALEVTGDGFSIVDASASSLAPQESRALEITFTPPTAGDFSGNLRISSDDPATPTVDIPLAGSALAAPAIDVDTSPVALSLAAGEVRSIVLNIANSGESTLLWQGGAHPVGAFSAAAIEPASANLLPSNAEAFKFDANAPVRISSNPVVNEPKPLPFADGFESGRWTDSWFTSFGTGKAQVTSESAGEGTYSFKYYGQTANKLRAGIHQQIVPSQPDYLSFRVRSGSTSQSDAYVTIGDDIDDEAIFFFSNQVGFWSQTEFPSGDITVPVDPDRWYHVECRNIDWGSRTFDYYIDGELIKSGLGFRSSTVQAISRINLFNFSAGSEAWWDDIRLGINTATWLRLETANGEIASHQSMEVTVTVSAAYLQAGAYEANVIVSSNDPLQPQRTIPVSLVVTDAPAIHVPVRELNFGDVVAGATASRTVRLVNTGTEQLTVSALMFDHPAYASDATLPFSLNPGEAAEVAVQFAPDIPGVMAGQLRIVSNSPVEPEVVITLNGTATPPPSLQTDSSPISISVAAGATMESTLSIANTGGGQLQVSALFETEAVRGGGAAPTADASILRAGGPDGFGYTFRDENELDGPVFQWREIAPPKGGQGMELVSLTGSVPPSDCNQDDYNFVDSLPLPFEFPFYGIDRDSVSVSAFGTLFFEGSPSQGFGCWVPFPGLPMDMVARGSGTNAFIATYLDRLKVQPGAVYWDADTDQVIVQHYQMTRVHAQFATFQTILYPNGDIRMQWYETGPFLTGASNAVIGIQGNASTALQVARNVANTVVAGRCIYFTYPGNPYRDWLRPVEPELELASTDNGDISFSINAQYLLPGTYHGSIELRSNDPTQALITVPLELTVTDPATDALALIRTIDGSVIEGGNTGITENNLFAAAPAANKADIVYTVLDSGYGTVLLDGSEAAQFSQQDLADGMVSYLHDGSDASAVTTISLQVSDGSGSVGPFGLLLGVTPVNDPPSITGPEGFSAAAGLEEPLDGMMVDDPDISHVYANWRVTLEVSHGTLHLDTTIGGMFNGGEGSVENNGTSRVSAETWLSRFQTNFGTPGGIRYTALPSFTGTDTLVVTIRDNGNSGSGSSLTTSRSFPITVHASDFIRWQHDSFSPAAMADPDKEATVWGAAANPDRDPFNNLMEYLLVADPLAADGGDLIEHGYDGVHQWLRFPVRARHPGVAWQVEWNSSFEGSWSTSSILIEELEVHPTHRLIQARLPFVDPGARFLRLSVWEP